MGNVSLYYQKITDGGSQFCIATGDVRHSQNLSAAKIHPWVAVKPDGINVSGRCTYMAGFGEVCSHATAFYPLLVYIGERVTRYKVLVAGIIIINFAAFTVLGLFVLDFNTEKNKVFELLIAALKIVGLAIGVLGAGLFNANIIQFGTDQIQFGSSKDMVTFARWFMLFYSLAVLLSGILRPLVAILSSKTILLYGTGGVIISASITALLLSTLFKKSFIN